MKQVLSCQKKDKHDLDGALVSSGFLWAGVILTDPNSALLFLGGVIGQKPRLIACHQACENGSIPPDCSQVPLTDLKALLLLGVSEVMWHPMTWAFAQLEFFVQSCVHCAY